MPNLSNLTTTVLFNNKEYEADITGYHTKSEPQTSNSPEVYAGFEIESINITPNEILGTIDLMATPYYWAVTKEQLEEIESDFFTMLEAGNIEG